MCGTSCSALVYIYIYIVGVIIALYYHRKQTKTGVPVVLAVNKCESEKTGLLQTVEFWSMGLGEPLAISALHGNGVGEVLEAIMPHVYEADKVNWFSMVT